LQVGLSRPKSVVLTAEKLGEEGKPVNWYVNGVDADSVPFTTTDPISVKAGPTSAELATRNCAQMQHIAMPTRPIHRHTGFHQVPLQSLGVNPTEYRYAAMH
jgi:hypothetical protein